MTVQDLNQSDAQRASEAPSRPEGATRAKRVFIVGCRRSGTTWTMMLFAHHPNVVTLRFADFFRPLKRFGAWWGKRDSHGLRAVLRDPADGIPSNQSKDGLAEVELKDILPKESFYERVRAVADDVYDRVAGCKENTLAVVEQTPENVRVWEDVLATFPDAYFIHVIRDPRSIYCSHRNASRTWADPTRFSSDPIEVAKEWGREVRHGLELGKATDRYFELRYEDLRADPIHKLQRLFEWLGLPAGEELCVECVEATRIDRVKKSTLGPSGFFRAGQSTGWREEMSATEVRTVEHLLGPFMDELGYATVNPVPVGPTLRVRINGLRNRVASFLRRTLLGGDSGVRSAVARVAKPFPRLYRTLANTKKNLKKG